MRKFPRVVRLDSSDLAVFGRAAEPGEWAVPGSFAFTDSRPETLSPKARLAFHSAWLGCESFAYAALVEVAEIDEAQFHQVIERLARHFVAGYGAPDLAAALPAARAEAEDAAGLSDHKVHQLLAIERELTPDGLIERVRLIHPERATDHTRIWEIGPGEGDTSDS